jgi:hypothetical protein
MAGEVPQGNFSLQTDETLGLERTPLGNLPTRLVRAESLGAEMALTSG